MDLTSDTVQKTSHLGSIEPSSHVHRLRRQRVDPWPSSNPSDYADTCEPEANASGSPEQMPA